MLMDLITQFSHNQSVLYYTRSKKLVALSLTLTSFQRQHHVGGLVGENLCVGPIQGLGRDPSGKV